MLTAPVSGMAASSSSKLLLVLAVLATATTAACKKDDGGGTQQVVDDNDDPTLLAEDGTDSSSAETDTEVVTGSLVAASTMDATGALSSIGDGAKAIYLPRGCLVVTSNPDAKTVSYAFDGCRGPNGIFKITGTVNATYAYVPGKLSLDLTGEEGLVVNRASVDYKAHGEITWSGAMRTMVWTAALNGTTARGRVFTRNDSKTLTWSVGERCFSVDGVSDGNVKGRYVKTEIAGFSRCAGACPSAGGRITITNDKEKVKVEVLFDGTSTATYSTPKGTVSFDLACES